MSNCNLCPRRCNVDRSSESGFCGESKSLRVARIAPHFYEEPPISGSKGSGTIFFSGCNLRCVFCQNGAISQKGGVGKSMTGSQLKKAIIELAQSGVHNINLVTPTHFWDGIIPVLEELKGNGELNIPVVCNTSGYESIETLRRLDGLIDIYLPDLKYYSPELADKYSSAPDYPDVSFSAAAEMFRQVGKYKYSNDGLLESGLVIRHLVLPSCRKDSIKLLRRLADTLPPKDILISLMSQYTPEFARSDKAASHYPELMRRVTSFEYSSVVKEAELLGFEGFIQSKDSANSSYTPNFNEQL